MSEGKTRRLNLAGNSHLHMWRTTFRRFHVGDPFLSATGALLGSPAAPSKGRVDRGSSLSHRRNRQRRQENTRNTSRVRAQTFLTYRG